MIIRATETTGTTTATAIVPLAESPEPPAAAAVLVADAVADDPLVADALPAESPVERVGREVAVDVIVRVRGPVVPSVGDSVIIEVTTGEVVGASVVLVEDSSVEDVVGGSLEVVGCGWVVVELDELELEDVDELDDVGGFEEVVGSGSGSDVVEVSAGGTDVVSACVGVAASLLLFVVGAGTATDDCDIMNDWPGAHLSRQLRKPCGMIFNRFHCVAGKRRRKDGVN